MLGTSQLGLTPSHCAGGVGSLGFALKAVGANGKTRRQTGSTAMRVTDDHSMKN